MCLKPVLAALADLVDVLDRALASTLCALSCRPRRNFDYVECTSRLVCDICKNIYFLFAIL